MNFQTVKNNVLAGKHKFAYLAVSENEVYRIMCDPFDRTKVRWQKIQKYLGGLDWFPALEKTELKKYKTWTYTYKRRLTWEEVQQGLREGKHKYAYLTYHYSLEYDIKLRVSINPKRKSCFKWEEYQHIGFNDGMWRSTTRPCKNILSLNIWRWEE